MNDVCTNSSHTLLSKMIFFPRSNYFIPRARLSDNHSVKKNLSLLCMFLLNKELICSAVVSPYINIAIFDDCSANIKYYITAKNNKK